MTEEVWKDIEGYEGLYQVSNLGRVKSLGRTIMRASRWGAVTPYTMKPRILKPALRLGYLHVGLFLEDGTRQQSKVHRLVAKAFIPNPKNLPEVNHKDEDKTNNCVDNLEWCTHVENCNYGTRTERTISKTSRPVIQMDMDGNEIATFPSIMEASRRTGIFFSQIQGCCKGRTRYTSAGGYRWKLKE